MSLKGDKYETLEEIKQRIQNSIVMYDGAPVYISDVTSGLDEVKDPQIARVFFVELPYGANKQRQRKYLSSKKFDLATPPLGYANLGDSKDVVYFSRAPVRQYQQGLTQQVLKAVAYGKGQINFDFVRLISDSGFTNMLLGKYPCLKEASDGLGTGQLKSVALSKRFALTRNEDLDLDVVIHSDNFCGIIVNGRVKISNKFKFLKQEAEEVKIPLA